MKPVFTIAVIAAVSGAAVSPAFAQGEPFKTACAKPGDERVIEIISPGQVGATCDVRYTYKTSNTVKVPYHANSSASFCAAKAQEIVTNLSVAGYSCASIADDLVVATAPASPKAVAPEPAPAAPSQTEAAPVVQAAAPQVEASVETPPATFTTPAAEPVAEVASAPVDEAPAITEPPAEEPAVADEAQPAVVAQAPAVQAPVAQTQPTAEQADPLGDKLKTVLEQPVVAQHEAVRGPADLTDKAEPNVPSGGRRASVVGRLVGAEPEVTEVPEVELAAAAPEPQAAMPVTQASATVAAAEPKKVEAPASQAAPVAEQPKKEIKVASVTLPSDSIKSRDPKDVIRATLRAQSAAWNEGNLDAFMEGYWKSDDLKFVSGTEVTKGWSTTQKRYRNRYGGAETMGQLDFDKMNVELITDDVAVVTGKFNLDRDDQKDSGVFTLVMKRIDGAWRIVHDHTVAENSTKG